MIEINFTGDEYSNPVTIKISAPKPHWLGKVESGEYELNTPDSHARKNMMPLPAVRNLMANGDLPFVQFGKKAYVLEKVKPQNVVTKVQWPSSDKKKAKDDK